MEQLLIPLLASAIPSIFTGIMGGGKSDRDQAIMSAIAELQARMPELASKAFSKTELDNLVKSLKTAVDASSALSKLQTGTSLAEGMGAAGVPKGHASSEMFVSANAPLDAKALETKAGIDQFATQLWADMDNQAKNRILDSMRLLFGGASSLQDTTSGQRALTSGLQTFNILSSGFGNLAEGWSKFKK